MDGVDGGFTAVFLNALDLQSTDNNGPYSLNFEIPAIVAGALEVQVVSKSGASAGMLLT